MITLAILLGLAPPALARVASIRTTAPLADRSDQAVKAAFTEAVEAAVRGAVAMGLSHVALNEAVVLRDAVFVEILATDRPEEASPPPQQQPSPPRDEGTVDPTPEPALLSAGASAPASDR
jgi:hypothetical protein